MPNAIIAEGMVIFIGSVLLHHDPLNEVADKIVVVGTQEDAEEVAEEDEEVVRGGPQQPVGAALIASGSEAPGFRTAASSRCTFSA